MCVFCVHCTKCVMLVCVDVHVCCAYICCVHVYIYVHVCMCICMCMCACVYVCACVLDTYGMIMNTYMYFYFCLSLQFLPQLLDYKIKWAESQTEIQQQLRAAKKV